MRKIISLVPHGPTLYALCDDGSMFKCCFETSGRWVECEGVPQPTEEAAMKKRMEDEP